VRRLGVLGLILLGACRGEPRPTSADAELVRLVDSLTPSVELAVGLPFKRKPRARMISREQARAYLVGQMRKQLPGDRAAQMSESYKLLGLLPDTLDLRALFLNVLTEQVAGYYDPDSGAFFGVEGASPIAFRTTVSHELVHALQHDYLPLDSIMTARDDADRLLAAQSVLEGQATLAMLRMQPEVGDRVLDPDFWEQAREGTKQQQASMPQFAGAPRVIRETLLFPYIDGADYIRWWLTHEPRDQQPYGKLMPRSSEEILDPERSRQGDVPLEVTFSDTTGARYGDVLGAAEMRVLLAEARGQTQMVDAAILGWGGDRFELYPTGQGDALVWIIVFDSPPARDGMVRALAQWPPTRPGYKRMTVPLDVSGRAGLRLAIAPNEWGRWSALPTATAAPEP
jgi:hypothetical protein